MIRLHVRKQHFFNKKIREHAIAQSFVTEFQ